MARLATFLEQRQQGLLADDDRIDIHRIDAMPFAERRVLDLGDNGDSRGANQRVEPAVLFPHHRFDALPVRLARHIVLHIEIGIEVRRLGRQIGRQDLRAGRPRRFADLPTDAAGRSGDDGDGVGTGDAHGLAPVGGWMSDPRPVILDGAQGGKDACPSAHRAVQPPSMTRSDPVQ